MKSCIIEKYYQSKRDPSITQTTYLSSFHGGERLRGDWTLDATEAFVFDRKSWAKSIVTLLKSEGLNIVEV